MNDLITDALTDQAVQEPTIQTVRAKPKRLRAMPMQVRLALALGGCVALVLCRIAWPAGTQAISRWIIGDGSEQVQQAFFGMERALEAGEGLGDAWEAFCAELTDAPA